jgi:hypothetical protein
VPDEFQIAPGKTDRLPANTIEGLLEQFNDPPPGIMPSPGLPHELPPVGPPMDQWGDYFSEGPPERYHGLPFEKNQGATMEEKLLQWDDYFNQRQNPPYYSDENTTNFQKNRPSNSIEEYFWKGLGPRVR